MRVFDGAAAYTAELGLLHGFPVETVAELIDRPLLAFLRCGNDGSSGFNQCFAILIEHTPQRAFPNLGLRCIAVAYWRSSTH